jgi:hypothetical protein
MKTLKLMRETYVMGAVCLLDLILTLWLIQTGRAVEGNPVMQAALGMGIFYFILVKCVYTFAPLGLLEMVGRRYTDLVRRYLRLGIAIYVCMHLASILAALIAAYLMRRV